MDLVPALKKNKGIVSSTLNKQLAKKALSGDPEILKQAVDLITFEKEEPATRAVRSAAAKIIEMFGNLRAANRETALAFARRYEKDPRKTTRLRAAKILRAGNEKRNRQ